jgi:HAD superfamily hydrolase (TIGR01509 family)
MTGARCARVVVFDLDGTLLDSLPLVLAAIRYAIEPFGGRATMDIFGHLGGPPERFMRTLIADARHVPEAIRRMERYHHENFLQIQPYAGVRPLLAALGRAGVPVAVWTGRDRSSTDRILQVHRMADLFSTVVCGDDLTSHKPDPAGLREILHRLEVNPGDVCFVGDADVDVLGGFNCGVDTVLIRHARVIDSAIAACAWATVATPADAYRLVLERADVLPVDSI